MTRFWDPASNIKFRLVVADVGDDDAGSNSRVCFCASGALEFWRLGSGV